MIEFLNLTIAKRATLVADGWRFADGIPAEGGYRAALEGGGYEMRITPAPGACLVEAGTPAYHATVAWRATT